MEVKTIKILYVEDDADDVELVKEFLEEKESNKFDIIHVDELSKGLQLLANNGIDIVLLDLSLPDCIGLETFRRLRSKAPQIPIIVLTGTTLHRAEIRECMEGTQSFMVKGYINSDSLKHAITDALEKKRLQEKLRSHFINGQES